MQNQVKDLPPVRPKRFFAKDRLTEHVAALLCRSLPGGRVLDLPAGAGRLTQELSSRGYEVVPADLFPEGYGLDDPACTRADMLKPLPFADNSFDAVVNQEGIEHIDAPTDFLRERRRVLKPGGSLWITTPNVLHMTARMSYLLTGHRTCRRGYINEVGTVLGRKGEEIYHGHAFLWRYPQLRYLLRLLDFDVARPECGAYSTRSVCYSVPLWPVLRIAHWRSERSALRKAGRHAPVDKTLLAKAQAEVRRHMLSRPLLWGSGGGR